MSPEAAGEPSPGERFGDYVLERRLGGGGFGSVWRAHHSATGQLVALKILKGRYNSDDEVRIRTEVELLSASASQESPAVVRVLSAGFEPSPYVVMEYIEGRSLEAELAARPQLPVAETLRILQAMAGALAALAKAGIIHRDVKPANVMLDSSGAVKLTDFGIAKIAGYETVTATGQLPMTAAYAAPEVWGGDASHKSDVYALGAMAFQCLSGHRPFSGSYVQLYEMHRNRPPDLGLLPVETPPALRLLVTRCMEKEQGARPTAADLLPMLAEAEAQLGAPRAAGADVPAHEPRALGPWLVEAKHPSRPWTFLCRNEATGDRGTVEVHFSGDVEYGALLRKALAANPALVPLGAERLLGTNRLILRPGERWAKPPPGAFQFWVAREELPLRPGPAVVTRALLAKLAAQLAALRQTAAAAGLELSLPAGDLSLVGPGEVHLRRPGLAEGGDDDLAWLQGLPLDAEARAALALATDLAGLATPVTQPSVVLGVAAPAATIVEPALLGTSVSEMVEADFLIEPPETAPPPPPSPTAPPVVAAPPPPPAAPAAPSRPGRRWQWGLAGLLVVAPVGLAAALLLRPDSTPVAPVTPTATTAATPTPARTPSSTATSTTTSAPPTATPVPPTATPVSPTSTPRSALLATASPTTVPAKPDFIPTSATLINGRRTLRITIKNIGDGSYVGPLGVGSGGFGVPPPSMTFTVDLPTQGSTTVDLDLGFTAGNIIGAVVTVNTTFVAESDLDNNTASFPQPPPPTATPTEIFRQLTVVNVPASSSRPISAGISVKTGQRVRLTTDGLWCVGGPYGNSDCRGGEGLRLANLEIEPDILWGDVNMGALIGRWGTSGWFYIGPGWSGIASSSGDLQLIMNDRTTLYIDNSGSLKVTVEVGD